MANTNDVSKTLSPSSASMLDFTNYFTEKPVVVLVGPETNSSEFHLSPSLLKSSSKFFRTCLGGEYLESKQNQVKLPEHNPADFRYFVAWLMVGKIQGDPTVNRLITLWFFGDSLMCEGFQNCAMDMLRELFICTAKPTWPRDRDPRRRDKTSGASEQVLMTPTIVNDVFNRALEGSKIVEYCIAQMASQMFTWTDYRLVEEDEGWHKMNAELHVKVWAAYKKLEVNKSLGKTVTPASDAACKWHVHSEGSDNACGRHEEDSSPIATNSPSLLGRLFGSPPRPNGGVADGPNAGGQLSAAMLEANRANRNQTSSGARANALARTRRRSRSP